MFCWEKALHLDLRICQRHPSCINILGAKKEDHCYDQNLGSRKINHVKHVMLMDRHQVSRPNLSTELVKRKPVFTNKNWTYIQIYIWIRLSIPKYIANWRARSWQATGGALAANKRGTIVWTRHSFMAIMSEKALHWMTLLVPFATEISEVL